MVRKFMRKPRFAPVNLDKTLEQILCERFLQAISLLIKTMGEQNLLPSFLSYGLCKSTKLSGVIFKRVYQTRNSTGLAAICRHKASGFQEFNSSIPQSSSVRNINN